MKNKAIQKLNAYLGGALGFNPYGEPNYQWDWSDDLMWPAFKTGRMIETRTPEGLIVMGNEYVRSHQTSKRGVWIVTKWFGPEDLPDWHKTFPGADYPARGYRIQTDWHNRPGVEPTMEDTQKLIWQIHQIIRTTPEDARAAQVGNLLNDQMDEFEAQKDRVRDEQLEEYIPAFVNPTPGKRGGSVSVPATRQDKAVQIQGVQ
jgi:hypothetical protein